MDELFDFIKSSRSNARDVELLGTFKDNKSAPLHSWFSYTEGFSSSLVRTLISTQHKNPQVVLDPFGGSGTTGVEVVMSGISYEGYDINPAMVLVANTKTISAFKVARMLRNQSLDVEEIQSLIEHVVFSKSNKNRFGFIFGDKPYFSNRNLKQLINIRENIEDIKDQHLQNILLTALLSIMIEVSNLKRAPDLKYKPEGHQSSSISAAVEFERRCKSFLSDLKALGNRNIGRANNFVGSALTLDKTGDRTVDLIITSPPYLNGTNYIKNTKLELWISGHLKDEKDMKSLNKNCVSCSINTAQKTTFDWTEWSEINKNIKEVHRRAYDSRITPMVANYFHDMHKSIENMYRVLKKGGFAYVVIGDSAFNNVHIPTHLHLITIARSVGFKQIHQFKLRDRKSRGGRPLTEDMLVFER